MKMITSGNPSAEIWLIGDAPSAEDVAAGQPFTGSSGRLLTSMLQATGFDRSQCFLTNVCHERPPGNEIDNWFPTSKTKAKAAGFQYILGRYVEDPVARGVSVLHELLGTHNPRFIVTFGSTPLWALTGNIGIRKWRSSVLLASTSPAATTKLVSCHHPTEVLRQWELHHITVKDLRRAKRESLFTEIRRPQWDFTIRPTLMQVQHYFDKIMGELREGIVYIAADIETRARQIACIGLAHNMLEAICIPILDREQKAGYWKDYEEVHIIQKLREILTHPNARLIFQNGAYDLQYFIYQYGFEPRVYDDTMLMQHVAFPGMRKGLDFLSSLYCEYHRYWKDDGKEWADTGDEDKHWTYNAEDCVRTYECWVNLNKVLHAVEQYQSYRFKMDKVFPILLRMMVRGIKMDLEKRNKIRQDLDQFILDQQAWLATVLGYDINVNSPIQMQDLFYNQLRQVEIRSRKTGNPTVDDAALDKIEIRTPILRPLIQSIRDIRSARVALANVINARISPDNRVRCTYNPTGAETFRLSSSEDAFGDGFNLQNLTKGNEE